MAGSIVLLAGVALMGVLFFPINRMYTGGHITFARMLTWYSVAVWIDWVLAWPLALWLSGFPLAWILETTLKIAGAMAVGFAIGGSAVYSRYRSQMEGKGLPGLYTPPDPGPKVRWYHVAAGAAFVVAVAVWFQWGPQW